MTDEADRPTSAMNDWVRTVLKVDPSGHVDGSAASEQTPGPKLDLGKAVAYLDSNAEAQSSGNCAAAVRRAILAGGVDIRPNPIPAKNFGPALLAHGFAVVSTSASYNPLRGDVAVIDTFPGDRSGDGHMTMFNGTQWVSDFRQRDIWGGPKARAAQPAIRIYRHP